MLKTGLSEKETTGELHNRGRKERSFLLFSLHVGIAGFSFCSLLSHFHASSIWKKKIKQRQSTVFHGTFLTPLQIAGFTDFYSWCQPWCEPAGTGWLAELVECGKETRTPSARLSSCRLLTLLFLLSGFASVVFLFALLHSSLITFFIFMCPDTNWQRRTEPGSCCLSWCLQVRKSKCKGSCA